MPNYGRAALSGIGRTLSGTVAPLIQQRREEARRKREEEDKAKKRRDDITKAYSTYVNQGIGLPEGGKFGSIDAQAINEAALRGAEATLLQEGVLSPGDIAKRVEQIERKKTYSEIRSKLPSKFLQQIEPVEAMFEMDPKLLGQTYLKYTEQAGKEGVDPEIAKSLGTSAELLNTLQFVSKNFGAPAARAFAKKHGLDWATEEGKEKPQWQQEIEYADSLTMDNNGNLIPWDKLNPRARRVWLQMGKTEEQYRAVLEDGKDMPMSFYISTEKAVMESVTGIEAMFSPMGKAFSRWKKGEHLQTGDDVDAQQKEAADADDAVYWPKFEKTFEKDGTVKVGSIVRKWKLSNWLPRIPKKAEGAFYQALDEEWSAKEVEAEAAEDLKRGSAAVLSESEWQIFLRAIKDING